jgi:orotidine-5'-phosphate decarboxylase
MPELIIAVDVREEKKLEDLLFALSGQEVWIKLGFESLYAFGLPLVARVRSLGFKVFADVKLHDIPNTVGAASRVVARSGAQLFNVHCAGGQAMCAAAAQESADEAARLGLPKPLVVGVTILTSLAAEDLSAVGYLGTPKEAALRLARVGHNAGLDGVVCSVQEAAGIKGAWGAGFLAVCPGIRPAGAAVQDQKRVASPRGAIEAGADFLVVGRPVTGDPDPAAACADILRQMQP